MPTTNPGVPLMDTYMKSIDTGVHWSNASVNAITGLARYQTDFWLPMLVSSLYFQRADAPKLSTLPLLDSLDAYLGLAWLNADLVNRSMAGVLEATSWLGDAFLPETTRAVGQAMANGDIEPAMATIHRQAKLMDLLAHGYPQAIDAIEAEYGFHFERGHHELVDETDRFYLYQISPSRAGVEVRSEIKPVCILPPYVLGANILGFLPDDERSYAHSFANQGVPTYIRILKDIATCEPLQTMCLEDDALDTQRFCEVIRKRHTKPVTLNGYCQGGFNALCNLLSGKLDDLVDAFITCVAPMDGTRSKGLSSFLKGLPQRFNDLAYGIKTLPNGNSVADGHLMGWVYKIKSIESESPLAIYMRDLLMLSRTNGDATKISKTAAALNHWLAYERNDLPLAVTEMSFASYNTPITPDGTLPIKMFGKALNLTRLKEKRLPWLICYGIHDDLVEKETALAPLDFVPAEVTPFPKGHVAIATSWSDPNSDCALHTRFGKGRHRGPVRFHLDLDADLENARTKVQAP